MSYTTRHADGTGHLQRGWYAYDDDTNLSEADRYIGPWRTERGVASAIEQAEAKATAEKPADEILCELAIEAGKTPAMAANREIHERVRAYME